MVNVLDTPIPIPNEVERLRFFAKVRKLGEHPDAQWEWTAVLNSGGYGRFWLEGRFRPAHAVSFVIFHGESMPAGVCAMHTCDVLHSQEPGGTSTSYLDCVNPHHVQVGTHLINVRDREEKGRGNQPKGDQHGSRLHPERLARGEKNGALLHPERLPRGERHGNSRLVEADVIEMRARRRVGASYESLGIAFGVSGHSARCACLGITWAHVGGI